MEEDVRKGAAPATHVKFFYQLRRDELFRTKENFQVTLPSVEDILGDTLTAFAPNTTGVLYGSGTSLEILKQLFDVGELVTHASAPLEISLHSTNSREQIRRSSIIGR